jgi:hypothetical protein
MQTKAALVTLAVILGGFAIVSFAGLTDQARELDIMYGLVIGIAAGAAVGFVLNTKRPGSEKAGLGAAIASSWKKTNRYLRAFYISIAVFFVGLVLVELIGPTRPVEDAVLLFGFPVTILSGLAVAFMLRKDRPIKN